MTNIYEFPGKEDVEITVGDEKQQDFFPRMKIKRWGNEVNFSVGIISTFRGSHDNVGDTIEWNDGHGVKARFYGGNITRKTIHEELKEIYDRKGKCERCGACCLTCPPDIMERDGRGCYLGNGECINYDKRPDRCREYPTLEDLYIHKMLTCGFYLEERQEKNINTQPSGMHEGVFEFEIELQEKPETNIIKLSIETKGLNFYYQSPLTQQDIDNKCFKPDNVVGSYAVYHQTMKGNYLGGKNYRVGKAFHIYRPETIDATGAKVWCDMNITDDVMTIAVPQEFVDNASYPIIIDPTFGCDPEVPGGSEQLVCNNNNAGRGTKYTGVAGSGVSMSFYGQQNSGTYNAQMKLYNESRNEVTDGVTNEISVDTTLTWRTANFPSAPTLTAQDYWLMIWSAGFCPKASTYLWVKYDDGAANHGNFTPAVGTGYNDWQTTVSAGSTTHISSIYVTYTPPAAGIARSKIDGGLAGRGLINGGLIS